MATVPGLGTALPPIPGLWDGSPSDLVQKAASDALDLAVSDSGSVPADANVVTGDTFGVSITEAPIEGQSIEAADYLDVYLSEPSRRAFGVRRDDALQVSLVDSATEVLYDNIGSDALDLTIDDTAAILYAVPVADDLDISVTDDVGARSLARTDSLAIGLTDAIKTRAIQALDTLGITVSGSLSLSGAARSLLRGDDFNVQLNDAVYRVRLDIALSDSVDLGFDDSALGGEFTPISDFETLTITLVEDASVTNVDFDSSWDSDNQPWGGPLAEEVAFRPVLLIGDSFYQVNPDTSSRAGINLSTVLERIGIVPADPTNILLIRALHPLVRAARGTVLRIYVGMQDSPEDPITWQGPFSYIVGSSYFVDPVLSGRYISLRIESENQPPWRILNLDIDLKEAGRH